MDISEKLHDSVKTHLIIWICVTLFVILNIIYCFVIIGLQKGSGYVFLFGSITNSIWICGVQLVGFDTIVFKNRVFYPADLYKYVTCICVKFLYIIWIFSCIMHLLIWLLDVSKTSISLTNYDYFLIASNTIIIFSPGCLLLFIINIYPCFIYVFNQCVETKSNTTSENNVVTTTEINVIIETKNDMTTETEINVTIETY